MTLPMVTCPLCCRPGFTSSDSLRLALVDVTTRKLSCPICKDIVIGLDKFTIHLFSHSINKTGLETPQEPWKISTTGNNSLCVDIKSRDGENMILDFKLSNDDVLIDTSIQKRSSFDGKLFNQNSAENGYCKINIPGGVQKPIIDDITENSFICCKTKNGQLFSIPAGCIGTSLRNVTINTQNYITNTNITTSSVQATTLVENIQKRKYKQVFDSDIAEYSTKAEANSTDNYQHIKSINSWTSTSRTSPKTDKICNDSAEKEFDSCKDLLTKADFSTLTDDGGTWGNREISSMIQSTVSEDLCEGSNTLNNQIMKEGFICDLCTIVFPNKTILAMHKQLIHKKPEVENENERKLLCNMCPRTFSLQSSLMIHRKVAHAGGFG